MATYTITVRNQSSQSKSYVVFMAPPPARGLDSGQPPYANVWASLDNVTGGSYDSVVYAEADVMPGSLAAPGPAPSFYVSEDDDAPGQVIDPSQASDTAVVDFTGRPQTSATVTHGADGGFLAQYNG